MIFILYGPPGSGKNFVAEWLVRDYGFYFYDADMDLTDDMKQCLFEKHPFTQVMRDNFFKIVIKKMRKLIKIYPNLVMAQAISRERNRAQLSKAFSAAKFVHIDANYNIMLKRLVARGDLVSPDWVDRLFKIQQPSNPEHYRIDNNKDIAHLQQQYFSVFSKKEQADKCARL